MPSYATIGIIGHVGGDPDLHTTASGKSVVNLSVAVNTGFGDNQHTSWYRLSVWGKTAEWAASNIHKGDLVFAEGEPSIRDWTDRDGNKRANVEIFTRRLIKLTRQVQQDAGYDELMPAAPAAEPVDDDLPF